MSDLQTDFAPERGAFLLRLRLPERHLYDVWQEGAKDDGKQDVADVMF